MARTKINTCLGCGKVIPLDRVWCDECEIHSPEDDYQFGMGDLDEYEDSTDFLEDEL